MQQFCFILYNTKLRCEIKIRNGKFLYLWFQFHRKEVILYKTIINGGIVYERTNAHRFRSGYYR